ncbi:hypothetical protein JCM10449v2_007275 [Rhodotorula kratochvilovae]
MASLFFQTASAPLSASRYRQQDSPAPRYDTTSLPWAASPAARARFPTSTLSSTLETPASAASQQRTSSSADASNSAHTSPATSLESGGDSEDEPHLLTPEDRLHAFAPKLASPAPVHPLTSRFDFESYRDEASARSSRKPVPEQALSASAKAFFPSFNDFLPAPSSRGVDSGVGLGIWVGDAQDRVDELARQTAELDLRKMAAAGQPRRDSFTFYPSPTLRFESPSPSKLHSFASSAALRSPQPSPAPLPQDPRARCPSARAQATTAPRNWSNAGYFEVSEDRAATLPSTPFASAQASPPLVPIPSRLAPPPLQPYIALSSSSTARVTSPGAVSLAVPYAPSPGCLLGPTPPLAVSTRSSPGPASSAAVPHEDYPLSPADTDRIAHLHNGRIPSLQQLAPPQQGGAALASPVINTGNQGPMVVQAGDWRCGVICIKCFPYAHDIGNILTIRSQQAAYLAQPASNSTSSAAPPPTVLSHFVNTVDGQAASPTIDAYFDASAAFPQSIPPQRPRTISDGVPSASIAALARSRTSSAPQTHEHEGYFSSQPAPALAHASARPLLPTRATHATAYAQSSYSPAAPLAAALAPAQGFFRTAPSTPAPRVTLPPNIWASPTSATSGGSSSAGSAGELAARRAAAGRMHAAVRGRTGARGGWGR